jgi:hypothetical protein
LPRAPNQRNAPCRHRALVRAVRTAQLPPANRAAEYRDRSVQLDFAFDTARHVHIWGTTGEQYHQGVFDRVKEPVIGNLFFFFTAKILTTIPCNNMKTKTDDPQFWSSRAEEVRAIAEGLKDGRRDLMLRIADDYDLLAGLTKSALVARTR